jgi:serine/threonine protein kinase
LTGLSDRADRLADAVRQAGRVAEYAPAFVAPPASLRDYRIESVLGEGGMGTVYRAVHTRLGRPVALKLLTARRRLDPEAGARFEREMRAIGALRHPHIVQATDAGEVDGVPYLVMELLDGRDLSRIVHERGPMSVADACEAIRQAALGLQHAHEYGLVHRDVKPSNLMLTSDGTIKLLDLGLARSVGLGCDEPSGGTVVGTGELTDTQTRVGTENYMAPEQRAAPEHVTLRADLYALGRTFTFLLTGAPDGAIAGLVPAGLQKIAQRLQSERQEDRIESAAAVATALEPWCREHNLPALIGRGERRPRPRPWKRFAIVAVAAVAATTAIALYFANKGDSPVTPSALQPELPPVANREPPKLGNLGMTAAEAVKLQQEWAEYLAVEIHSTSPTGMKLTLIPPGEFNLSVNAQARISRPYFIGSTEVTRGQFRQFVNALSYRTEVERKGTGTYLYKIPKENDKEVLLSRGKRDPRHSWENPGYAGATDEYPVTQISWDDANAFCRWLTSAEG